MKTFTKTFFRMLRVNKGRFIANVLMILLSITISAGLLSLTGTVRKSLGHKMNDLIISDIIIKTNNPLGFTDEEINEVKEMDYVLDVCPLFTYDILENDIIYRKYNLDFSNNSVNKITLLDGSLPSNLNECVLEQSNDFLLDYQIGDTITLSSIDYKVVGIVENPLYLSTSEEPYLLDVDESVDVIMYTDSTYDYYKMPYTDLLIDIDTNKDYFSDSYDEEIDERIEELKNSFNDEYTYLSLNENASYELFRTYTSKIQSIAYIFPIFFIVVAALVVLITLTRLIQDERKLIACNQSLGIKKSWIINKYLSFAFLFSFIGGIIGLFIGVYGVPAVVYPVFTSIFLMPDIIYSPNYLLGSILVLVLILISMIIVYYILNKELKETPAALFLNKAPKPGKRILLEKIPFIWKPLPFRYKSSIRNIIRKKKNLILTILSVIGSSVLIFIGFALYDNSVYLKDDPLFGTVIDSIGMISFVIITFAMGMCILIIYNLNNMNILERQRELATLKVLGYQDIECSFYTFREILIISALGGMLAIPISYFLVKYVFIYLDFGSIDYVRFYAYILPFIIIILLTIIVNFLLYKKVKNINMNDSLKTLD